MQQSAGSTQSRTGVDWLEAEIRFSLSPIIAAAAMILNSTPVPGNAP
jgi:hypothetical protein